MSKYDPSSENSNLVSPGRSTHEIPPPERDETKPAKDSKIGDDKVCLKSYFFYHSCWKQMKFEIFGKNVDASRNFTKISLKDLKKWISKLILLIFNIIWVILS